MSEKQKEEKIINGVDVSMCDMQCANGDCALYYAEVNTDNPELEYGYMCSDNPECYYKQLQREKQKNKKLEKTLKEIEEIAKRDCFVVCNSYDFKECCDKGCINSKILKKTKEVKNDRAWNKKKQEMKKVAAFIIDADIYYSLKISENKIVVTPCKQPYIVLMQCTGLKDKNGKLIYEGDILKDGLGIIGKKWMKDVRVTK